MINDETLQNISVNSTIQKVTSEEAANIYNNRDNISSSPSAYMSNYDTYKNEVEQSRLSINSLMDYKGLAKSLANNNIYSVIKDHQDELKEKEDILSQKKFDEQSVFGQLADYYNASYLGIQRSKDYKELMDAREAGDSHRISFLEQEIQKYNDQISQINLSGEHKFLESIGAFSASGKEYAPEVLGSIAASVGLGVLSAYTGGATAPLAAAQAAKTALLISKIAKIAAPTIQGALIYNKSADIEAGGFYEELSNKYPNMDEAQKRDIAMVGGRLSGAVEALGSTFGIGGMAQKFLYPAITKMFVKDGAKKISKEVLASEGFQKFFLNRLTGLLKSSAVGGVSEGSEEVVQNALHSAIEDLRSEGKDVGYLNTLGGTAKDLAKTISNVATGRMTDYDKEQLETLFYTATTSGMFNLLLGGVGTGISYSAGKFSADKGESKNFISLAGEGNKNLSTAEKYMENKKNSEINKLSHDAYVENSKIMIQEGVAPENVYMDVDMALMLMQEAETNDELAVAVANMNLQEKLNKTGELDEKIALSFEEADDVIFDPENDVLFSKIKNGLSFQQDTMSKTKSDQYIKDMLEQMPTLKSDMQSDNSIVNQVVKELQDSVGKDEAIANATLAKLVLTSLNEATGNKSSEEDIIKNFALKIQAEKRKSAAKKTSRAMTPTKKIFGKDKLKGVKVSKKKVDLKDVQPNDIASGAGVQYMPEEGNNVILYEDKSGENIVVRGNEAVASAHLSEGETKADVTVVSAKDGYTIDDAIKMADKVNEDVIKDTKDVERAKKDFIKEYGVTKELKNLYNKVFEPFYEEMKKIKRDPYGRDSVLSVARKVKEKLSLSQEEVDILTEGDHLMDLYDNIDVVLEPFSGLSYEQKFFGTKDEKLYQIIKDSNDLAEENARLDDMYTEYKGETINVNGKEKTVYNSNGDKIAKSEEALRNFYKWFGDSKVVDEQGRPKVMYHGTRQHDISEFKSRYGDKLIFFAYKREFSERWAKNAYQSEEQQEKARKISDEKHDKSREISKRYNKDFGENWTDDEELFNSAQEELKTWQREREEELGIEPIVMDVYLKAEKTFVPSRDWEQVLPELLESNGFTKEDAEVSSPEEIKKAEEEYERKVAELDKKEDEQKVEPDSKEWEENSKEYDRLYQELQAVRNKGKSFQSHLERIKKGAWVYFERESVMKKVRELGYDSIRLKEMSDGEDTTLAVFEGNNQIKSIDNQGTYSLENDNIYLQAPEEFIAGYYDPKQILIHLTEASNPTTFAHELMHFHQDMMNKAYNEGRLTDFWAKEYEKAVKWSGGKIVDGKTVLTTENLEKMAEGFTTYLATGKAPVSGLEAFFDYMRELFFNAYRAIKGLKAVRLSKNVTDYYDAILIKEDEANKLKERERYGLTEKPEGVSDEQWANYLALQKRAHSETVSTAYKNTAKIAKQQASAEYQEVYDKNYQNFLELLQDDVQFQAWEAAKSGGIAKGSLTGKLTEGHNVPKNFIKDGGLDAEIFMRQGEFNSVDELADFLTANTSTKETASRMAKEQADEWLKKEYPDLVNADVVAASRNVATIKAQLQEAMMLKGIPLEQFSLYYANLVNTAEQAFNSMKLSKAKDTNRIMTDINTLSERYRIASLKDDKALMSSLRWQSAIANYTLMRAYALKSMESKFNKHFQKYKTLTPKKSQLKIIEGEVWDMIHHALYNFKYTARKPADPTSLGMQINDYVNETNKETFLAKDLILETSEFLNAGGKKSDMTVNDFAILNGSLRLLENVSKKKREIEINGKKQNIEDAVDDIILEMDKRGDKVWEKDDHVKNQVLGNWGMKETLLSRVFPPKIFRAFVLPFMEGLTKKALWISEKGKILGDLLEPMYNKAKQVFVIDGNQFTYENLFVILLNSGNEHNRKCMIRTLKEQEKYGDFQEENLQSLLDQMPKELRALAQKVWDFFEENTEDFKKAQQNAMGAVLKMVEPSPVTFSDGETLRGGYYPAWKKSLNVEKDFSADSMMNMSNAFPIFGFQKERGAGVHGGLEMITKPLETWLYQMSSMINVSAPYMNLYSLIHNQRFINRFGEGGVSALENWMRQSIQPETVSKGLAFIDSLASVGVLGFRAIKMLVQITGFVPAMVQVGGYRVLREIVPIIANPVAFITVMQRAKTLSNYMNERFSNPENHLADVRRMSFLTGGKLKKGVEKMDALGMYFVAWGDAIASYATWNAQYKKSLEKGLTEEEAKLEADSMVRRLQGDTSSGSRPPILQGYQRFLTKFASYFIGINSLVSADVFYGSKAKALAMLAVAGVLAPMAEAFISYQLEWEGADDDKKERWRKEGINNAEELLQNKLVTNIASSTGASIIPLWGIGSKIGSVAVGEKNYGSEIVALTYIDNFINIGADIYKYSDAESKEDREKALKKAFEHTLKLVGIKTSSVKENINLINKLLRRL